MGSDPGTDAVLGLSGAGFGASGKDLGTATNSSNLESKSFRMGDLFDFL